MTSQKKLLSTRKGDRQQAIGHTQVARFFQVLKRKMQKMKIFLSTALERVLGRFEPFLLTFVDFK